MRDLAKICGALAVCLVFAALAPAGAAPQLASGPCTTERGETVLAVGASDACSAGAPAAVPHAAAPCAPATNEARCATWEHRIDGTALGPDSIGGLVSHRMVTLSRDGKTLFTAGVSDVAAGSTQRYELLVAAVDAGTGESVWSATFAGEPGLPFSEAMGVDVAPDGRTVVATASLYTPDATGAMTVALDAATGALLWRSVADDVYANGLAIDAGGRYAYVVGGTRGEETSEALTTAYDLRTGQVAWSSRFPGATGRASARRVASSPDGDRAYVAAAGLDGGHTTDVVLLVYDAASGALLRDTHHPTDGFPPAGIDVSADGSLVVIEEANLETSLNNALTLAYDADGNALWQARFGGCDQFKCSTRPWYSGPVAVSADGARVFVTSLGVLVTGGTVFHTTTYDGATGALLWSAMEPWNAGDCFCGPSVDVTPDGDTVVISGFLHASPSPVGGDGTTVAYNATTGAKRWSALLFEPGGAMGTSHVITAPDSTSVFVGGGIAPGLASGDNYYDAFIAAYDVNP